MGLINFIDVKKSFGNQDVLKGVTFTIEKGERVALVGPNGAGKTTLLRIAQGFEAADTGFAGFARGVIPGVLSQDLSQLSNENSALEWREVVEIEKQLRDFESKMSSNAEKQLMKQYEQLTARYEAIGGYTIKARLKATLLGLGLSEETMLSPLSQLSSGEKMRAALARVLLSEPDLLLLDEPTNHLDIKALEWLEDFLIRFEGGVLFISHDRYFLSRVSTRVIELSGGTVLEHKGSYATFMQQKEIKRQFVFDEAHRLRHEIKRKKELITQAYHYRRHKHLHKYEKELVRLENEKQDLSDKKTSGHLDYGRAALIDLSHDLNKSKRIAYAIGAKKAFGERVLFESVEFLVRGGDRVGIIGSNGCGKSTLIKMLLGLDNDFEGICELGSWVKYVFIDQSASFDDESLTPLQEVHSRKEMTDRQAKDTLARVGLYEDEYRKPIEVLSGGERVRLKLCLAMLDKPQCLILDEPTNHLDLPAREAVESAIREFSGSVIAVSHDRAFLSKCVNKLFIIENGRLNIFDGNWQRYQDSINSLSPKPQNLKTKKLINTPVANAASSQVDNEKIVKLVEEEITKLEQAKAGLELRFESEAFRAEREDFEEYAEIEKKLADLYTEWETLNS